MMRQASPLTTRLFVGSALEGAEDSLFSASGMCTATTMLLALVPAGGHIITTTDCYRRTRQFIQTMLPKMGITVLFTCTRGRLSRRSHLCLTTFFGRWMQTTVIDPSDLSALQRALDEHPVSLFFSESPTNPYLRCVDVRRVAEVCPWPCARL